MCNSAATARIADLLSSSCFSYSCFTEFAFTLVVQVARSGSMMESKSEAKATIFVKYITIRYDEVARATANPFNLTNLKSL